METKKKCYTFKVKTIKGNLIKEYPNEWLTEEQMESMTIGMLMGVRCRLQYPFVEVYEIDDTSERLVKVQK